MTKKHFLSILFILIFSLSGFFYSYTNVVININNIKINEHSIIAHAGGGIANLTYLNSKEGFYYHYSNGTRIFEYDFVLSEDNEVITSHKWEKNVIGREWNSKNRPTLSEFMEIKIAGEYSGLSIYCIIDLMEEYPDISIILDSKDDIHGPISVFRRIIETISNKNHDLLERVIPFLYDFDMLEKINELHEFNQYIFLVDAFNNYSLMTNKQIMEFVLKNDQVTAVMFSHFRLRFFPKRYIDIINKEGKNVYAYTINRKNNLSRLLNKGVSGFVSDFITQDDFNSWIVDQISKK